jgi:hypothetical protein
MRVGRVTRTGAPVSDPARWRVYRKTRPRPSCSARRQEHGQGLTILRPPNAATAMTQKPRFPFPRVGQASARAGHRLRLHTIPPLLSLIPIAPVAICQPNLFRCNLFRPYPTLSNPANFNSAFVSAFGLRISFGLRGLGFRISAAPAPTSNRQTTIGNHTY